LENKITLGIIGCSRIAKNSVLPAINNSKFAKLEMIGSRNQEKAQQLAEEFNCKNFGTYEEVLENKNVTAVYVSVPVGLHEEWTIKAAKSRKNVLCEKSSTSSYKSACRMVETCRKNKIRLMEGFMFRFHPQLQKVIDLINGGKLGMIFSFSGFYGFPYISHDDIRYKKNLGGGVFNDAACYPICASRIIFGEKPVGVMCKMSIDKDSGVDTKASIFLSYSNERIAHMSVGYDLEYQGTYHIWGSKGSLKLNRSYNIPSDMESKITLTSENETTEILIPPNNHFKNMVDSFCSELLGNSSCNFNWEDDLLMQAKVMEAARISNAENRFIEIK